MENKVMEIIGARSSARAYSKEQLTEEQLHTILEAGLKAPTGLNHQEIRFTVVKGEHPLLKEIDSEKRKLRGQGEQPHNFYYEAPVLIFLSSEDGFKWSTIDAGIAVENMVLAAESLGLGTLIIGCIYDAMRGEKKDYFSKELKIPKGHSFEIALAVGQKLDQKVQHEYDYEKQVTIL